MNPEAPIHPINYVAKRTGLSIHAIRVWERRYNAVTPHRNEGNRRLYSDLEINRLRMLAQLSNAGHTISRIANLKQEELEEMVRELNKSNIGGVMPSFTFGKNVDEFLESAKAAVVSLNDANLEIILSEAKFNLSRPVLLEKLVGPLMTWIGEQWESGEIRIGHEHMASGVVRDFLSTLRMVEDLPNDAPVIVVTTPSGQAHEIGALLAATVASSMGWCDVYLGPNLPAQEIANVAINRKAPVIALSICMFMANSRVLLELEELRKFVGDNIPIVAGGRGANRIQSQLKEIGILYLDSFPEFRDYLSEKATQPVT